MRRHADDYAGRLPFLDKCGYGVVVGAGGTIGHDSQGTRGPRHILAHCHTDTA
jgi:hypothetical protein